MNYETATKRLDKLSLNAEAEYKNFESRFICGHRKTKGGKEFQVICYDRKKKQMIGWPNQLTAQQADEMALMLAKDRIDGEYMPKILAVSSKFVKGL